MSYRDELEAARQRADALERELEEKERALADKAKALAERDRALAEKEQALADAKEDLDEVAADRRMEAAERAAELKKQEREKAKADAGASDAREKLESLVGKGKKPRPAKAAPKAKPAPAPGSVERRRLLRSVTTFGEFIYSWDALIVVPISAVLLGFVLGYVVFKLPVIYTLPAGALTPLAVSFVVTPLYAKIKLAFLRRWPGTLPYRLEGYPALLEVKPRRKEVEDSFMSGVPDRFRPKFDPEGHTTLRLALRFSGEPPPSLAEILRGFDPDLRAAADSPTEFSRESPVSEDYSKGGSRRDNIDDNWKVHKWIRRCHRKVLRHLAAAQGLVSARISLH